jgi:hypothetical protein
LSLLVNFAIIFLLLGLYLLVKNSDKRMLWGGILCMLVCAGLLYTAYKWDVTQDLIGIHVIKNTRQEYLIQMQYFSLKPDAITYYQKHKIANFSLVYRYEGDTQAFFEMIGNNKNKIKQLKFEADSQHKRTAFQEYQDFFGKYKLIPAYNSKKPE